tara:strand:- start:151 stop:522 length:372 start_codon:yes stop_codon:yes gene_type:complete
MIKDIFFILFVILFLDFLYISTFGKYFSYLFQNVQKSPLKVNLFGFVCAYILLTFAVYYFGFLKNLSSKDMFILGFCIYGVYDLTNYTTFKNWEMKMVILDSLWGGTLFYSTHKIVSYLSKKN